jgi:5'(3')-deoxyribonucleotidase
MPIFIDLDEVLADFTESAARLHGLSRDQLEVLRAAKAVERPGGILWDIAVAMGLTDDEFWEPISALGEEFWLGLKPLPWCNQMLELVKSKTDNWFIVTSPSKDIECYTGKIKWIDFHLGAKDRAIITRHKSIFSTEDSILIDDKPSNLDTFIARGGQGVLVPTPGNTPITYKSVWDNPVDYVAKSLERLERIHIENYFYQGAC